MNQAPKPSKKRMLDNYGKYSSLAFQMVVIIGLGVWGGVALDRWTHPGFPVFTLVLSLLSVALAIYTAIKDFIK